MTAYQFGGRDFCVVLSNATSIAFNNQNNKVGIGTCLRNEHGQFIKAKVVALSPLIEVHQGEGGHGSTPSTEMGGFPWLG